MVRARQLSSLAAGLAAALVLVIGLMSKQMAMHALHHAHHKAATHASVVCTWMCAAGQVVDSAAVDLDTKVEPRAVPALFLPKEPEVFSPLLSPSRGPPSVPS